MEEFRSRSELSDVRTRRLMLISLLIILLILLIIAFSLSLSHSLTETESEEFGAKKEVTERERDRADEAEKIMRVSEGFRFGKQFAALKRIAFWMIRTLTDSFIYFLFFSANISFLSNLLIM